MNNFLIEHHAMKTYEQMEVKTRAFLTVALDAVEWVALVMLCQLNPMEPSGYEIEWFLEPVWIQW
jgi:hypothetical protein